jgi:hypothetical protein
LPKGYSPEAIAQEAISRLWRGKRSWNRDEYPGDSPLPVLKATVDSIVSELMDSPQHLSSAYIEDEEKRENDQGQAYKKEVSDPAATGNTSMQASPEEETYLEDVVQRIRMTLQDREDLVTYFEYLLMGMRRKQIAGQMSVTPERVSELRKQFQERTKDIYLELLS